MGNASEKCRRSSFLAYSLPCRVSLPYASNGLYLETEAGYHKLASEAYGFTARVDGDGNLEVLLSDKYFNKTCGLCGNYNIFAEDDFRTQEGEFFLGAHFPEAR